MFTIRDFVRSDYDHYITMSQDFYSGDAAIHTVPIRHFDRTFDAAVTGSPLLRALMLELDGQIAGYALLSLTWSNEAGGPVVWAEELYVLEQYRCQKLGSQFFEWLFQEYKDAARLRLEVCRQNPRAQKLYERYGFEILDYIQMIRDRGDSVSQ